jgi:hypothetical protein
MLWALASSVFVIYLYRTLNAESAPTTAEVAADSVEAEIAALNARISALESKLG